MRSSGKLAVIDLGTNTFHLLVVQAVSDGWLELYRERIFVNLAEDGIAAIGSAAWQRGTHAIKTFAERIAEIGVEDVRAIGTAALRRAANSEAFVSSILSETGISVEVIDGEMEANYIKWGVENALTGHVDAQRDWCIMDVGGGSVEFCLSAAGEIVYTASFPLGVAVLYDSFHKSEPISAAELEAINNHLESTLTGLKNALQHYDLHHLIGASGSFEILDPGLPAALSENPYVEFDIIQFRKLYHNVIGLNLEQRLNYPQIPASRARYFVCAIQLIKYALDELDMRSMGVSRYALKEGVVHEWRYF